MPDQDAVIQFAKEKRRVISKEDAETLVDWADEYDLYNSRIDMGYIGRSLASQSPHLHIGPVNHIPIID